MDLDKHDILSVTFNSKTRDFRFVLRSGAVIRAPLSDEKGKEMKDLGIDRVREFIDSQRGRRGTNKETMEQLMKTTVYAEIF